MLHLASFESRHLVQRLQVLEQVRHIVRLRDGDLERVGACSGEKTDIVLSAAMNGARLQAAILPTAQDEWHAGHACTYLQCRPPGGRGTACRNHRRRPAVQKHDPAPAPVRQLHTLYRDGEPLMKKDAGFMHIRDGRKVSSYDGCARIVALCNEVIGSLRRTRQRRVRCSSASVKSTRSPPWPLLSSLNRFWNASTRALRIHMASCSAARHECITYSHVVPKQMLICAHQSDSDAV